MNKYKEIFKRTFNDVAYCEYNTILFFLIFIYEFFLVTFFVIIQNSFCYYDYVLILVPMGIFMFFGWKYVEADDYIEY